MKECKWVINKNILLKEATEKDLGILMRFQESIIENMEHKEFFQTLNEEEFLYPINDNGKVYLLYDEDVLIGFFVISVAPPMKMAGDYEFDISDIAVFDAVMIKEEYRGSGLQRQAMEIAYDYAKDKGLKALVATVHPENFYSLNNCVIEDYKIIRSKNVHGGERLIVYKEI